jgi:hypothetical protein
VPDSAGAAAIARNSHRTLDARTADRTEGRDRTPRHRAARVGFALAICLTTLVAASPPPNGTPAPSTPLASASPAAGVRPLVFAYYYIWYATSSWRRAKTDLPTLGTYDSRDRAVVAQHLAWARDAGIDGLIVSWKHEQRLDDALQILVDEASKVGMKLILLYQGLDFDRLPLDPQVVAADLTWFIDNYGDDTPFDVFGLPTIVWSGTWGYTASQLQLVRTAVQAPQRALLLGSERSADAYATRTEFFDGDAYYWSSPDPLSTPRYQRRLDELAAAVRRDSGRWIAPAAPGFDARLVGGTSIVPRRDGATYRAAWDSAMATRPDVLGIISWNEFSENSQVEPSETYGRAYLDITTQLVDGLPSTGAPTPGASAPTQSPAPASAPPPGQVVPDPPARIEPTNIWGAVTGIAIVIALFLVGRTLRRRSVG